MTNKVRRQNKELSYRSYLETFYKPSAEVNYNWDVSKETMQAAKLSVSTFAAAVSGIRPFGTPEEWDTAKEQAKGIWENPLKIKRLSKEMTNRRESGIIAPPVSIDQIKTPN